MKDDVKPVARVEIDDVLIEVDDRVGRRRRSTRNKGHPAVDFVSLVRQR